MSQSDSKQSIFNEETRKAIEDARNGIGLTEGYHSAAELFAALDAEEDQQTGKKSKTPPPVPLPFQGRGTMIETYAASFGKSPLKGGI